MCGLLEPLEAKLSMPVGAGCHVLVETQGAVQLWYGSVCTCVETVEAVDTAVETDTKRHGNGGNGGF